MSTGDAAHGQLTGSAADVYDQLFVPALFAQWPPILLGAAGVTAGDHVLDVGCGTGILAAAATTRVGPGGRVVGLDPNDSMLTVARRRPEAVEWHRGAAEEIPFDDGSFSCVVSQFALMFFRDRRQGVGEMARVAAPGATVALATWASADRIPGYRALVDLVRRQIGQDAADALAAPFCLGEPAALESLVAASFADVEVRQHAGRATFGSIEAWVEADVRGWTLADLVDDEQHQRLLAAAHVELAPFTDAAGRVDFAIPALIATGRRR